MKTVCPVNTTTSAVRKRGANSQPFGDFQFAPIWLTISIADEIQRKFPGGVDKVLKMIGTVTLEDSLRCAKQGGIVCMKGIVGNPWSFDRFAPMDAIPTGVYLTV